MIHASKPTRRAWTLIECLLAISIVAVLLSLLFPALAGVRRGAERAVCLNNLRSFGQAIHAYMQTSRSLLPVAHDRPSVSDGRVSFFDAVGPFLDAATPALTDGQVTALRPYVCPNDKEWATYTGISYDYVPGSLLAHSGMTDEPAPELVARVTAMYQDSPDLPLMRDAKPWHVEGRVSGQNVLYFDGRACPEQSTSP